MRDCETIPHTPRTCPHCGADLSVCEEPYNEPYDLLRDRPQWWHAILRILSRQRNANTNAWNGSYRGLINTLTQEEGVEVTQEGVRYALRQLEHLGLIERDHTSNHNIRRLVIVVNINQGLP